MIEIGEEDMRVGKRDVSHGKVRVSTRTVGDQVSEDVTLETERAHIDCNPVDREMTGADAAIKDRTIVVEETSEVSATPTPSRQS